MKPSFIHVLDVEVVSYTLYIINNPTLTNDIIYELLYWWLTDCHDSTLSQCASSFILGSYKNRVLLIVLKFDSTDHDCYFSIFFSYIRNVSCMAFVYWMPSLTNTKKNPCPYHDCSDLINSFVLTLQVSSVLSLNYWLWMDPTAHSKKKNGPNCFCINNISTT